MTDLIHAVLLGILEGITEFLPISSTGHLIVATEMLGFRPSLRGIFEIFIQLGAVLAVVVFYRATLIDHARRIRTDRAVQRFWAMVALAFFPAAVLGVLLRGFIKETLFRPDVVAASLIVGGVVIVIIELNARRRGQPTAAPTADETLFLIVPQQAALIGVAQAIALIPGVSRSAASIFGGMFAGLDRATATRFSFFLAIPTLGGATVADLALSLDELNADDLLILFVGAAVAGVVAWAVIRWLLRYVATHDFIAFGIYRIVAGLGVLAFFAARGGAA
jgi:undecaprenyl-diphosphatase